MKKKKYETPKTMIFTNSAYILTDVFINDSFGDEVVIEWGKKTPYDDWWDENDEDYNADVDKLPHQKSPWDD